MAAEGICLWQRDTSSARLHYRCVHRLGRITDRSIEPSATRTHECLLAEIGSDGGPVVVPPTPHAGDSNAADLEVPANPTDVPVAIAPIDCDASLAGADYLLEVFLEPGGGVATQRGYLRFVAQMADLAGEFFRGDQLRSLRRREALASQVDELVARLHAIYDPDQLATMAVDGAADTFGFDRVGLLRADGRKAELIAVSHVHSIDQRSAAAEQLRNAIASDDLDDGDVWNELSVFEFGTPESGTPESGALVIRAITAGDSPDRSVHRSPYRFVAMQVVDAVPVGEESRDAWNRYAQHATLAMQNINASKRTKVWAIPNRKRWLSIAALTAIIIAAFVPVPLIVDVPAIIRPEQAQLICSPRNAVVDTVHVTHGQTVRKGDRLLTLSDSTLQEQITSLIGRRAVLDQQQSRLTEAMVDASSFKADQIDQVQMQQSLVAEEIQALEEQLVVLRSIERSLEIRADRDGIVDAWQIDERLRLRPVNRGDGLMRVVASESRWLVEARVPQNRIAHLTALTPSDREVARVTLDASPGEVFDAQWFQFGPAAIVDGEAAAHTVVLLRCDETNDGAGPERSGAPARVAFDCGHRCLGYVMFQDLIHAIGRNIQLYLS